MRWKICVAAAVLGLMGLCMGRDMAARGEGAMVIGAKDLKVIVAVPEGGVWMVNDDSSAVEVVLENMTGSPMELYQSWNSWGYFNVRLEWEAGGRKGTVTPVGRDWEKNFPSTTTVPAGGAMVREVNMGSDWAGWPALTQGMKLTVRAVYESKDGGGKGWTGKAESDPVTVEVRDMRKPALHEGSRGE